MRVRRSLILVALCFASLSVKALGQLPALDALVKNITDVGFYTQLGWPVAHSEVRTPGHYWSGFGLELSYEVTSPTAKFPVEFALAYSQTQTFRRVLPPLAAGLDSGEVRGGIREFPAAAVYVNAPDAFKNRLPLISIISTIQPYVGIFGGVVNVTNLRAFSPSPPLGNGQLGGMLTLKGDGSSFEGVVVLGLVHDIGSSLHAYIEAEHTWRTIPSIDWSGAPGSVLYPLSLPRSLDLSGPSLTFGLQVHISKGESQKGG